MSKTSSRVSIDSERIRLSAKYKYLIMPIEPSVFIDSLRQIGFSPLPSAPKPPIGSGISFALVGPVAQKGQNRIDLDLGRGIIAVEGINSSEVLADFQAVDLILKDQFSLDLQTKTWFVEAISEVTLTSNRSAIDSIRALFSDSALYSAIGNVMGDVPTTFGLRLGRHEPNPIDEDWFDFKIEPVVHNPTSYYISIVYRNPA